ncbi:glycosyl transferase family 1 [Methanofervidicoccus sp. A16]|uniref:glycosyltransferase family 4 protein n=1 Tax=Methanofervidicoccus sp. A16 TaxID=2607662 RepID=UPI00118C0294|nr:glycosyltransferase family 4 protein [Methanofervidicoccus sp. A16]AXI24802.1 glycosyl transferase family 1 [Methanofervidicoccus sp. A16]
MKILYICGREPSYVRNSVILKGLKLQKDVELLEYTSNAENYFKRYISVFKKYLLRYSSDCDIVYVGFLGQPIVPIVKILSKKPIIFDALISVYDTLCYDRKIFRSNSIMGKLLYHLDKASCDLADIVLLDTNTHITYFVDTFKLDKNKFKRIFIGADDNIFYPRDINKDNDKFKVFYYGTYLPLHGIEYIVKSAKILENYEDIIFKIVGKGFVYKKIINLVKKLNIKNIEFVEWVPYEELPLEIAQADICLGGHFSDIDKGKRVIAGKTFQFLAMKKPVIVGNNPANRELLTDRKSALFVEHANPEDLAEKILELKENEKLREKIAEGGYKVFKERCTPKVIGKELLNIMKKVI